MDKRTDINTASFAYSVSLLRIRISGYPPGAGTKRQSIHTAVLHGIAVFFCSTFFTTFHHYFIPYDDFCHACASAFMQVLFFICRKMSCCNIHQFDCAFLQKPSILLNFLKSSEEWRQTA